MLRAEGLAAEAIVLRLAPSLAPVALLALQMEIAELRTDAWRRVTITRVAPVNAPAMPATNLASRSPRDAVVAFAIANYGADRVTTRFRLANVRLTHTLRTFGSELHGQWRADEGIAPPPSALDCGLAATCNSPSTFPARGWITWAGYKTTSRIAWPEVTNPDGCDRSALKMLLLR
jgi:hypothetical protein